MSTTCWPFTAPPVEVIRTNGFSLKRHDKVIFLTADGGVVGKFSNELNQFHVGNALLDGRIIYDPFDVALVLVQNSFLSTLHGLTPNQKAVAGVLDGVLNDARMDAALKPPLYCGTPPDTA